MVVWNYKKKLTRPICLLFNKYYLSKVKWSTISKQTVGTALFSRSVDYSPLKSRDISSPQRGLIVFTVGEKYTTYILRTVDIQQNVVGMSMIPPIRPQFSTR